MLPTELLEAREAQRRALGRYLGESTTGVAVSPAQPPLAEGDLAARPHRGATDANGDATRAVLRIVLQTLERTTPEQQLLALAAIEKAVAASGSANGAVVEH